MNSGTCLSVKDQLLFILRPNSEPGIVFCDVLCSRTDPPFPPVFHPFPISALESGRFSQHFLILLCFPASSVVSSHGPSAAAKEHEKRILENILPPDLRHLIRGGSSTYNSIQV